MQTSIMTLMFLLPILKNTGIITHPERCEAIASLTEEVFESRIQGKGDKI